MTNKQIDGEDAKMKPGEAAAMLNVDPRTLSRMAKSGAISSVVLPSGHQRYFRSEIEQLATPTRAGVTS